MGRGQAFGRGGGWEWEVPQHIMLSVWAWGCAHTANNLRLWKVFHQLLSDVIRQHCPINMCCHVNVSTLDISQTRKRSCRGTHPDWTTPRDFARNILDPAGRGVGPGGSGGYHMPSCTAHGSGIGSTNPQLRGLSGGGAKGQKQHLRAERQLPPPPFTSVGPNFSHHKARVQAVGWFPLGTRKQGSRPFAAPPPPNRNGAGPKAGPAPPPLACPRTLTAGRHMVIEVPQGADAERRVCWDLGPAW